MRKVSPGGETTETGKSVRPSVWISPTLIVSGSASAPESPDPAAGKLSCTTSESNNAPQPASCSMRTSGVASCALIRAWVRPMVLSRPLRSWSLSTVTRAGTVLMNRPMVLPMPGSSVGRPDTVVPKRTSESPVSDARLSDHAAWSSVFGVTPASAARDSSAEGGTGPSVSSPEVTSRRLSPLCGASSVPSSAVSAGGGAISRTRVP